MEKLKVTYDREAQAMYFQFMERGLDGTTEELNDQVLIDKTSAGQIAGIDILGVDSIEDITRQHEPPDIEAEVRKALKKLRDLDEIDATSYQSGINSERNLDEAVREVCQLFPCKPPLDIEAVKKILEDYGNEIKDICEFPGITLPMIIAKALTLRDKVANQICQLRKGIEVE